MIALKEILGKSEVLEDFLLACSLDFGLFYSRVLMKDFAWFHKEWFEAVNKHRRVCIMAPRQHGKTTLMAGYIIWKVLFGKKLKILVVSDAHRQAMDILQLIKNEMDDNELLKNLVPKDRDASWSRTEIMTTTGCRVVTRANNPKIRGGSYDLVFCDEAGEYRDKGVFYGVVMPTVAATKGKIVVIGTPQSRVDLLADLEDPSRDFFFKKYKSIMDGKPLWSWKYSLDELNHIKNTVPATEWEREFMCNPVGESTSVFPFELVVKGFDNGFCFENIGAPNGRYFLGFDVAMSQSAKADYSVWTIIRLMDNGERRIVRIERSHGEGFESQFKRTISLYNSFKCVKLVIDKGSFGETFFQRFKESSLIVEDFNFHGGHRMDLLTKLRNVFENELLIIPRDKRCGETLKMTDLLLKELLDFRVEVVRDGSKIVYRSAGRHDDLVMSLALSVHAADDAMGRYSFAVV